MTSRRRTTSNQCSNNVAYVNVEIHNVEQRHNNVFNFDVDFQNADQRRNNVVNMTIWKKMQRKNWIYWTPSLDYYLKILLTLFPILREMWRIIFAKPKKNYDIFKMLR